MTKLLRRQDLEDYLQQLLSVPRVIQLPEVERFLGISPPRNEVLPYKRGVEVIFNPTKSDFQSWSKQLGDNTNPKSISMSKENKGKCSVILNCSSDLETGRMEGRTEFSSTKNIPAKMSRMSGRELGMEEGEYIELL